MRIPWISPGHAWRQVRKIRRVRLDVALAVLLTLAALTLIWWAVPLAGWNVTAQNGSLLVCCALTVTLALLVVTCWAVVSRRRRGSDDKPKEASTASASRQSGGRLLEAELEANLSVLRRTLGGRRHVDRLPWYLVLGSEGSGRSSLIHRSDETFSVSAVRHAGSMGGPGEDLSPDRSTSWWIGEHAVLIEPSATLLFPPADTTTPASSDEYPAWRDLLAWLARRRSRPCINGVVLVVEFPDLATQSPSDRRARSLQWKARLQELMSSAGARLPVYVILSKIDLLEGFAEFFARMPRATRDEMLGFTFSLYPGKGLQQWRDDLVSQYAALMGRLNEQMLDALGEQHALPARESMFSFVRQMAGLQPALVEFLDELMATDRHMASPVMRGVFFSSVCQHGILLNAFVTEGARSHDLPGVIPAAHRSGLSTVHFSRPIFRDVIYPEAGMAATFDSDGADDARRLWIGWVPASACLLFVVACWHHAFESSHARAMEVLSRAEMVSRSQIPSDVASPGIDLLLPMNELRKTALVYRGYESAWPVLSRLGFNRGYRIGPPADAAYRRILAREFLTALARGLLDTMERARPGSEAQLAALRIYRMIDERENRQKVVVQDWMSDMLQAPLSGQAPARDQMMQHLDYALDHVDPDLTDFRLRIGRVQSNFGHLGLPERVYAGLKADVAKENLPSVRLRDVVGPSFDKVFWAGKGREPADPAVDALFTPRGASDYFSAFRPRVAERALQDQWVIGNRESIRYSEADRNALIRSVEGLYTADYADRWSRALASIRVRKFDSLSRAVTVLATVTGPDAPFRRLLESVRANTAFRLDAGAASVAGPMGATEQVAPSILGERAGPVAAPFARLAGTLDSTDQQPSAYDRIIATTRRLHDYLDAIVTSHDPGKAALQAMTDRNGGDGNDPISDLSRIGHDFPDPFGEHFVRMADDSDALLRAAAMAEIQREWQTEVYGFYNQRLRTRYPFAAAAASDASIDDFIEFFGPKGRLARFNERHRSLIAAAYPSNTRGGGGTGTGVRHGEFPKQPEAVDRIRDAFFDEAGEFGLQFTLEPLGLTPNRRNSIFEVDGQLVGYSHGPSIPAGLIWPNTMREGAISRVTLVTTTGSSQAATFKGPWSLFRLLSQGHLGSTTPGSIELTFTAGDGAVRYRIASPRVNNPFDQRLFTGFSMPHDILPPVDSPSPQDKTTEESDGT